MIPLPHSHHVHHVLTLYSRARRHLRSVHAFQRIDREARRKGIPDENGITRRLIQERIAWFREDFDAARCYRRELQHEAHLERQGLFVRVEPYVKMIAFRPLVRS